MEPANVNRPPDDEAHLAALLRNAQAHLPDNGFTARVLAALPPPAHQPAPLYARPLVRNLTFTLAALAGLGFAISRGLSLDTLHAVVVAFRQVPSDGAATSSASHVTLAFAVAALSFLYAMKSRLGRVL